MMMPVGIASTLFSLHTEKQINYALTFSARLSKDGSIEEYTVRPVCIEENVRRISYDEVDAVLAGTESQDFGDSRSYLQRLHEIAIKREKYRQSIGAKGFVLPKATVLINALTPPPHRSAPPTLSLSWDVGAFVGSRLLVAEMMILASEIAAKFAISRNIPFVYRWQPLPLEKEAWDALPTVTTDRRDAAQMILNWSRAELSIVPQRHWSLGFEQYARVSSPARRYPDIVNHRQIKAALALQSVPYTTEGLSLFVREARIRETQIKEFEMKNNHYWLLRYLEQEKNRLNGDLWLRVTILKGGYDPTRKGPSYVYNTFIEDTAQHSPAHLNVDITPGSVVWLHVDTVVPHNRYLSFHPNDVMYKPPDQWFIWRKSTVPLPYYMAELEMMDL